jgi:hypothetical protein
VREPGRRVEVKRKFWWEASGTLSGREVGKSILLEGTLEIPVRPSDKDRMAVKTLWWSAVKV